MDFNCNFDTIDFCHYSSQGWGFQKSNELVTQQIIDQKLNSISNKQNFVPIHKNYFPCANSTSQNVPMLKKFMKENSTEQICLQFSYLIDRGGFITINNGREIWTDRRVSSKWRNITVSVGPKQTTSKKSRENRKIQPSNKKVSTRQSPSLPEFIEISGRQVCLDNLATVPIHKYPGNTCPTFPKLNTPLFGNVNNGDGKKYGNNEGPFGTNFDSFSAMFQYWLTQPISIMIAIMVVVGLLFFLGLLFSIVFSRTKTKPSSGNVRGGSKKSSRRNRGQFENSPHGNHLDQLNSTMLTLDDGTPNNNNLMIGPSQPECCYHHNGHARHINHRMGDMDGHLPALVHTRPFKTSNNNGIACCSHVAQVAGVKPGNVALRSQSSTSQSPQCRFSLALTEDAQLTLLSNEELHQQMQAQADITNGNNAISLVNNTTATTTMSLSSINSSSSSIISNNNSSNNGNNSSHSNGIQGNISQYSNSYHGNTSNPSYNDSIINHTVIEENEQALDDATLATVANGNHSPSPLSRTGQPARPNSILLLPAHFHTPLINDTVSDTNSIIVIDNDNTYDDGGLDDASANQIPRTRPICETLNIGYVSDGSLCDHLPHYDAALQLLARANQNQGQSEPGAHDNDDDTLHDNEGHDASDDNSPLDNL